MQCWHITVLLLFKKFHKHPDTLYDILVIFSHVKPINQTGMRYKLRFGKRLNHTGLNQAQVLATKRALSCFAG